MRLRQAQTQAPEGTFSTHQEALSAAKPLEQRGIVPAHLRDWRQRLLDRCYAGIIGALGGGSLLSILAAGGAFVPAPYIALACGLLLLGFHLHQAGSERTRSIVLLVVLYGLNMAMMCFIGWAPAFVGLSLLCVFLGGLLLGRRAVYALSIATAAGLAVGGLLVHNQFLSINAPQLRPQVLKHWLRAGGILMLVGGLLAYMLRFARRTLGQVYELTRETLEQTRDEVVQADTLRAARQEAERELRETHKMQAINQLSDGMAHHANNLLTLVRDQLEAIQETQNLEQVLESSQTLQSILEGGVVSLNELMAFSRKKTESHKVFDVGQAIGELHTSILGAIRENVTLTVHAPNGIHVLTSPHALQQALMGLVLNSLDALPQGGSIHIKVQQQTLQDTPPSSFGPLVPGDYALISVKDDGAGMSPTELQQAVDPFFTTKDPSRHPGLGLSTALSIVQAAKGTLSLQSLPHAGCTVTLYLPLQPLPDDDPLPDASAQRQKAKASHHETSVDETSQKANQKQGPNKEKPSTAKVSSTPRPVEQKRQSTPPTASPISEEPSAKSLIEDTRSEDLDTWLQHYVKRNLNIAVITFLLAMVVVTFFLQRSLSYSLGALMLATTTAGLGAWAPRLSHRVRVGLLLFSFFATGTLLVLKLSYLAAGPVACLLLILTASTVLASERLILASWLGIGGLFGVGGLLHSQGIIDAPGVEFTFNHAPNWFRIALIMGLILLIATFLVLGVLDYMGASIDKMEQATEALREVQSAREAEGERLLHLEEMADTALRARVLGQLAGSITHDLNNALQMLLAWTWELDLLDPYDAKEVEKILAQMEAITNYATGLVQQFDLQHTQPLLDDATNLGEAVQQASTLLAESLPDLIQLEVSVEPECFVGVELRDLNRIIFNAAQNAQHAMPKGGTLSIHVSPASQPHTTESPTSSDLHTPENPASSEPQASQSAVTSDTHASENPVSSDGLLSPSHVELCIQDEGFGMDAQTCLRAFEPFYSTKAEGKGTGLGLVALKTVVEQTKGTISLQSTPGQGTTLSIRWPRRRPPAPVPLAPAQRTHAAQGTILLAEDNDAVRQVFRHALQSAGFTVLEASDGDQARDLLHRHPEIDAVCLDGIMPGTPTSALIEMARAQTPTRPILLCSGYLPQNLEWISGHDDFTFIQKPIGGRALSSLINRLLTTHA